MKDLGPRLLAVLLLVLASPAIAMLLAGDVRATGAERGSNFLEDGRRALPGPGEKS